MFTVLIAFKTAIFCKTIKYNSQVKIDSLSEACKPSLTTNLQGATLGFSFHLPGWGLCPKPGRQLLS